MTYDLNVAAATIQLCKKKKKTPLVTLTDYIYTTPEKFE